MGARHSGGVVCDARAHRRDFIGKDDSLLRARYVWADALSSCREIFIRRTVSRFVDRPYRRIDALPAGGPGYWIVYFLMGEEPVHRHSNYLARVVSSRGHVVGVSF